LVFEVLFFFVFLYGLGFWLITSEALADWRRIRRAKCVRHLIHTFEGREVARAEAVLGPATEIITGFTGRRLYVWKGPESKSIPPADPLLIVTLTIDRTGIVTNVAAEER
jgi:hypothetical protein